MSAAIVGRGGDSQVGTYGALGGAFVVLLLVAGTAAVRGRRRLALR